MKKKLLIIAPIVLVLAVVLVVLSFNNNTAVYTNIQIPKDFEKKPVVIHDYEEYQAYIAPFTETSSSDAKFRQKLSSYDASFFEKNMLVLICYTEGSSSAKITVASTKVENDTVKVTLSRTLSHPSTDMSMNVGILIELPKDENVSKVKYTTVK